MEGLSCEFMIDIQMTFEQVSSLCSSFEAPETRACRLEVEAPRLSLTESSANNQ